MQLSTSTRATEVNRWTVPRTQLDGISILDEVFNQFASNYMGKWSRDFGTPLAIENWKRSWAAILDADGVIPSQVGAGIRACMKTYKEWPPTGQQFSDACNPPVDPVAAYYEAIAGLEARGKGEVGEWSHPAIYWAASKLARDLMGQSYAQVSGRWTATIKAQLARKEWEEIPPPRLALAAPGEAKLSREGAAQMIAQLGAMGITKNRAAGFDHLRWAKAIMERHARGDATLTAVQVREARAALESVP